jgi:hypothetical protein
VPLLANNRDEDSSKNLAAGVKNGGKSQQQGREKTTLSTGRGRFIYDLEWIFSVTCIEFYQKE